MFAISLIVSPITSTMTALESNRSPLTIFSEEETSLQLDETLKEMSVRIAQEFSIPPTILSNLVYSESRWDSQATSTTNDWGLVQINLDANPDVTKEQALDPEFSLRFAAEAISKDKQGAWTACNCYSLIKTKIKNLPKMKDIVPNSTPKMGSVMISYYKGQKHLSYVKRVANGNIELQEANYKPCLIAPRVIDADDPHIRGYWYPPALGG